MAASPKETNPDQTSHSSAVGAVAVAVIPQLGGIPEGNSGIADWSIRHSAAVEAVVRNIAQAEEIAKQAESDRDYFQSFYTAGKESNKSIRFAVVLGVIQEKGQAVIAVDNGWGSITDATVAEKIALWQKHKLNDKTLYQGERGVNQGELLEKYGMELYRSVRFSDVTGRGLEVKRVAEMAIGKPVRIFKVSQPWTTPEGKTIRLRVAEKMEILNDDVNLRVANENDDTSDDYYNDFASDASEAPPRPSRVQRPTPSSHQSAAPEPETDFLDEIDDADIEEAETGGYTFTTTMELVKMLAAQTGRSQSEVNKEVRRKMRGLGVDPKTADAEDLEMTYDFFQENA